MNNFVYMGRDPLKIAPKIEEIVRKDLGLDTPLPYTIDEGDGQVGSLMKEMGYDLIGPDKNLLFIVNFEFQEPIPSQLSIKVERSGLGCHTAEMSFTADLSKEVSESVFMEGPKTFSSSKFIGDATASAKLNSNKDLLKLTAQFARTKSDIGRMSMERYVRISPKENGSMLMIQTLGRLTSMGFGATTDAMVFFSIVNMVENSL